MQFSMPIQCDTCQGKGAIESTIYAQDIMSIVLHNINADVVQKIPAIKEIRSEYGIGLKASKELIEGAMAFYYAIKKHAIGIDNSDLSTSVEMGEWDSKSETLEDGYDG